MRGSGSSSFLLTLVVTASVAFQATAATLYWDGGIKNISTNGDGISQGGAGIWDATLQNWDQGSGVAHAAWNSAAPDSAVLGGMPGLITLGAATTAGSITVNISGYTLDMGGNALSANTLQGAGALTKAGAGTLTLSGVSPYTGALTIRDGMVVLNNGASLASGAGVIVQGGAGSVGGAGYPFKGVTRGGTLYLRDDSGSPGASQLGTQSLTLNNGTVLWFSGSGADVTALDTVSLAGGFNSLGVAPSGSPDVLKINQLLRSPGATVEFRAAYHKLGTGESQIQVTELNGSPIANVNGILGGWAFVAANTSGVEYGGQARDFAAWDASATIGSSVGSIVAATPDKYTSDHSLSTGLPSENWVANNVQTITADLTINSLIEQADVIINNSATLTLGSGGLIARLNNFWMQTANTGYLTSGGNDLYVQADGGAASSDQAIKVIIKDGPAGAVTLHKSGAGMLKLGKNNTYTGGTIINQGILDLQVGGSSGTIRGTATVNPGGTLRLSYGDATGWGGGVNALTQLNLNGGTLAVNTAGNQTFGGVVINMTGGSITGPANGNIDFLLGGTALNSLASPTTSTISGVPLSPLRQGNTTFSVADGPAEIDLEIASVIRTSPSGDSGTLSKDGPGTLRLTAVNTFARPLNVKAGTLLLSSTASLGANVAVTVSERAALGGSGTLYGTVIANADSTLAAGGRGTIGTLTLANTNATALTLNNAKIACDLSSSATCDNIAVAGTLVLNNANTVALTLPDNTAPSGIYTLMTFAAKSGSGTLTLLPAIRNATLDVSATNVTLTVGVGGIEAESLVWQGDGVANIWDTAAENWLYGSSATAYIDGEAVIFNDTGSAAPAVNIVSAVTPGSVMVNNTSQNFTIGGGPINGVTTLTKAGSGSLALTAINNFTGAVVVDGGTLEAAAATTANPSAIGGGANPVTVNRGAQLLFTGNRSAGYHSGSVTLNGGTITGNGGDLSLAVANAITFDNAPGLFDGTGLLRRRDAGNVITVRSAASGSIISITELNLYGGNSIFNIDDGFAADDLTVSSTITGLGKLTKNNAGTLALTGVNTYSGGNELLGGTVSVNAMSGLGTGYIALKNGTVIQYTGAGSETRSGTYWFDTGNAVLSVTNPAAVLTLWRTGGNHNKLLIKRGAGTLRYGATSDNNGASAQVNAGVLEAISSVNNAFGNVTVNTGGEFRLGTTDGTGAAVAANRQVWDGGSVTLNTGGVLALNSMDETIATLNLNGGAVSGPGTLTMTTAINAQAGSAAASLAGAGNLNKSTTGTLTLSGANTFSGTTTVSAGTLLVNGTHTGAGAYTVAGSATLGGTGNVALASGAVTMEANATLAPGTATGGGQLTLGTLTLNADAGILIDSAADSVAVTGDLTFNDNAITLSNVGLFAENTRYVLLSYTGTLSGAPVLAADYGRWILRHDAATKTIYLINNTGTVIMIQ